MALAHQYSMVQIIETLTIKLHAPDSPARRASTPSNGQCTSPQARSDNRFHPGTRATNLTRSHVSAIGLDTSMELTDDPPDIEISPSNDSIDVLIQEVNTMVIPKGDDDQALYYWYAASVNHLGTSPNGSDSTQCIICSGSHHFDGCSILNNTDFLHLHYIHFCQQLCREASAHQAAFPGSVTTIPAGLNAILTDTIDAWEGDDPEDQDFMMGHC